MVYGNKGTKRNNNGTSKVTDAKKTTCKTCGKQHKGECWMKKNHGNIRRNSQNGAKAFDKKELNFIKAMIKLSQSSKKEDSKSESEGSTAEWKKGVSQVQQMYIAQQYRADNGMDSEEEINSIEGDQLKSLCKRAKKAEKALKLS